MCHGAGQIPCLLDTRIATLLLRSQREYSPSADTWWARHNKQTARIPLEAPVPGSNKPSALQTFMDTGALIFYLRNSPSALGRAPSHVVFLDTLEPQTSSDVVSSKGARRAKASNYKTPSNYAKPPKCKKLKIQPRKQPWRNGEQFKHGAELPLKVAHPALCRFPLWGLRSGTHRLYAHCL